MFSKQNYLYNIIIILESFFWLGLPRERQLKFRTRVLWRTRFWTCWGVCDQPARIPELLVYANYLGVRRSFVARSKWTMFTAVRRCNSQFFGKLQLHKNWLIFFMSSTINFQSYLYWISLYVLHSTKLSFIYYGNWKNTTLQSPIKHYLTVESVLWEKIVISVFVKRL